MMLNKAKTGPTRSNNYQQPTLTQPKAIPTTPSSKPTRNTSTDITMATSAPTSGQKKRRESRMSRRFSAPMINRPSRGSNHLRLGIRMSMDLSGAPIQPYRHGVKRILLATDTAVPNDGDDSHTAKTNDSKDEPQPSLIQQQLKEEERLKALDEPNELKAIVVLETLMKAADIATLLQSWDSMVTWGSNLYHELENSHNTGRGDDPLPTWCDNQGNFLQFYILPVARHLKEMGVFQEDDAKMFIDNVERNKLRWSVEGEEIVPLMVDGSI